MDHKGKPFDTNIKTESALKLGITIHDNDFSSTLDPFLKLMVDDYWFGKWHNLTKERVITLFNTAAIGLYLVCQARPRGLPSDYKEHSKEEIERMRRYLTISERNVFLGDEVIEKYNQLMQTRNYNCDFWFTLDGKNVHVL